MNKGIIGLVIIFALTGCMEENDSNAKLNKQQEGIMQEANRQVGMPAIVNFQERKLLKQILELRDQENLICYAYIVPEMTGKLMFIGKCIGYGLPYSTEFTNPAKPLYHGGEGVGTIPQADPNGLFMPASAEGTWLMMVDPKGSPRPVYIEPRVIVSPFPLEPK